jgi:hypothetical protein
MNNNKIRLAKNTEFWVKRVVEEYEDEYGRKMIKTQWQRQKDDLNMGSIKNPQNQDVIAVKWIDKPNDLTDGSEFDLRKFFGGII